MSSAGGCRSNPPGFCRWEEIGFARAYASGGMEQGPIALHFEADLLPPPFKTQDLRYSQVPFQFRLSSARLKAGLAGTHTDLDAAQEAPKNPPGRACGSEGIPVNSAAATARDHGRDEAPERHRTVPILHTRQNYLVRPPQLPRYVPSGSIDEK